MRSAEAQVQGGGVTSGRARVRTRLVRRAPLLLWLLIAALSLVELWMIAVTLDRPAPDQWGFRGFEAVLALSFGSVGALIAARRPDNRIGWLLLALSVIAAIQAVVDQYPVLAEAANPPRPFAETARWIAAWLWVPWSLGLIAIAPLIFPDGRLLSPRWRLAVVLALTAMAVQIGWIVLAMRPLGPLTPTVNVALYFELFGPVFAASYLPYLAAAGVAASSLFLRYRRAPAEVRLQIKWVAYAQVVVAIGATGGLATATLGQVFFIGTIVFFAVALAIAILRYRLYEIDVIINRTLVYGALTAVLAGVYTASITLSQRLFVALTNERSDAAIVITTLIVAATFTPLKTRLQAFFDKRVKPTEVADAEKRRARGSFDWSADAAQTLALVTRLDEMRQRDTLTVEEYTLAKAALLDYTFGATPTVVEPSPSRMPAQVTGISQR